MRMKRRGKEIAADCAFKAGHMIGIGPLKKATAVERMKSGDNFEEAKTATLKDLLKDNLGYIDEELGKLSVTEMKFTTRGEEDILYVAFANKEDIKELYVRKAESGNDEISLRNYVPPNYYARYMSLNSICAEKRTANPKLKTQLRFGETDVEIYVKYRDENTGYRQVKISDFMDPAQVPQFDPKIRWKRFMDQPPRRKVEYRKNITTSGRTNRISPEPTTRQESNSLTRANSNSTNSNSKKPRIESSSSSSSASSDEDTEDRMEDDEEHFSTPTGQKEQ